MKENFAKFSAWFIAAIFASTMLMTATAYASYPGQISETAERAADVISNDVSNASGGYGYGYNGHQGSSATKNNSAAKTNAGDNSAASTVQLLVLTVWGIFYAIQSLLAYGTAYRKTRHGGDNGASLFGWLIAYNIAALIPGLGIAFWSASKKLKNKDGNGSASSVASVPKVYKTPQQLKAEEAAREKDSDAVKILAFIAVVIVIVAVAFILTLYDNPTIPPRYR